MVNGGTKNLDSPGASFMKGERQDIVVFLGSSYYLLDVLVKNPTCKSNSKKAMKSLGAAEAGEADKIKSGILCEIFFFFFQWPWS